MSGTKAIRDEKRGGKARRDVKAGLGKKGLIYSFNPTDEEKRAIRDDGRPSDEVTVSLERALQNGHVLTLKYNEKSDCFMALLREGTVQWDEAVAISCWHKSADMALRMMDYALSYRYPDFPAGAFQSNFADTDW